MWDSADKLTNVVEAIDARVSVRTERDCTHENNITTGDVLPNDTAHLVAPRKEEHDAFESSEHKIRADGCGRAR